MEKNLRLYTNSHDDTCLHSAMQIMEYMECCPEVVAELEQIINNKKPIKSLTAQEKEEIHEQEKQREILIKQNTFETMGMEFNKQGMVCECGADIWMYDPCEEIKERHPELGGVWLICGNNILLKEKTGGTGECEYENELPKVKEDSNEKKKPCNKPCQEKKKQQRR